MSAESDQRRVAVHAGTKAVDLTVPAAVPVATLMPSILDILGLRATQAATLYHLSRPGAPALPGATTLAQHGIRDGAVLLLTQSSVQPPVLRCDDVAEAVSATLGATDHAPDRRAARLTLAVIATVFAALTGLLAVPGAPDAPHVLLAAMAAAATSTLATRLIGSTAVTLRTIACFATLIATAALVGMLTTVPPLAIGSLVTLVSFGLLEVSARIAIVLSGLSPQLTAEPDLDAADYVAAKAIRADTWLTSLQAAFSASAAAGAILAILATPRWTTIAFAATTGSLLLLRARSMGKRMLIPVTSGTCTIAAAHLIAPTNGPWIAVLPALIAVLTMCLSFRVPAVSLSPIARRGVEALECLLLVTLVPLAGGACGVFSAVRGLDLT